MFNDMRSEVRNLLLVASELGGAATQYVKVLRAEKERLLPIDAIQTEMEELKAQAEQASAAEANMFKALMKANDRTSVVEKNAASCKGLLEQANADTCKARAAEANMLRSLKMANDNTYETQEEARELKRKLEQAQKHIDTLQVTNDEYKEQLTKQAEELEFMQTNRVHAEVYQNVAAERDRALAELRTQERSYLREVSTLNKAITKLEESLAQREQYDEEARQSLITQRNDAVVAAGKAQAKLLSIKALVSKPMSDIHAVAFKAAGKAQCSHDKTQVVADSVASFIRSPIRGVLES